MCSQERILVPLAALLLIGSFLLFTYPQMNYIPCFSFVSEQRREEEFLAWMREQQQRKARVAKICESDPSMRDSQRASESVMRFSFLFNPDHNLLGCLQPKVSCKQHLLKYLNKRLDPRRGISILCLYQMRECVKNWRSTNGKIRQACWIQDTSKEKVPNTGNYDEAKASGHCEPCKNLRLLLHGPSSF